MIAAFSITPLGVGESVGDLVAGAVRVVRESGLPNETNAMFTNIEGALHHKVERIDARLRDQ